MSFGAGVLRSRAYLPSEVMLATAVGIAVGPAGLDRQYGFNDLEDIQRRLEMGESAVEIVS